MKIIASKDFAIEGKTYEVGEEVKINNIETLIRLNEKGFINPLTIKEIKMYVEDLNKPKTYKIKPKEEE